MRVIHLLRKYDPAEWGGTESAVQRLFVGLREHGVTPVMYCPRVNGGEQTAEIRGQRSEVRGEMADGEENSERAGAGACNGISVRRFRACLPIWGISREHRRQLVAVGGNLMSFDLMPALLAERAALIHTHTLGRLGSIASAV